KYISNKRAYQDTIRDNTPFLNVHYNMATNKDRPLNIKGKLSKAERKRRNREGGTSAVIGSGSGVVDKYSTWSRDALLQRIRELESTSSIPGVPDPSSTGTTTVIPAHLMSTETSSSPGSMA